MVALVDLGTCEVQDRVGSSGVPTRYPGVSLLLLGNPGGLL